MKHSTHPTHPGRFTRAAGRRRRLLSAPLSGLVALATGLGLALVVAPAAEADITAPAQGAVLRGNATISASGASDGNLCVRGDAPQTTLQLVNPNGTVAIQSVQGGAGAKSFTFDTHPFPNGPYIARAIERNRTSTFLCNNNTRTTDRAVSIENITQLALTAGSATSGAQNTSVSVSAVLTDPNLATSVLPNRPVTFSLGGGASVTATTNAAGVATASLPLNGGPRTTTLTATFAATPFYTASTASTSFIVTKNASTTTLDVPATSVRGAAVSFTANVARADGTSTPTGTVQFTVDGSDVGAPVPVSGGQAVSAPLSDLATGGHTIGARYSGDANLLPSQAATAPINIVRASTTTALTSSGSPTVSGEAVTFTAEVDVVAPGAAELTGGVQFNIDGEPFGTAVTLDGDDKARLTVTSLRPGNHQVEAVYNGNVDAAPSTSAQLTHGVNRADTTVALETSEVDAVAGQPLTFTARVDVVGPGAGQPTGTVQFASDGDPIGDPVPLVDGVATSTPQGLDFGDHLITADYSGDDRFAGGSTSLEQEVDPGRTTTEVTTSPNPSVVGQSITVTADVRAKAPAVGEPKGLVRFTIDGQPGPFVDLVDGSASFTIATLTRGEHRFTATYLSEDPDFVTSTSPAAVHTVNRAATRTTVTSSSPTSVFGQPVTFTAGVDVVAPGAGAPSGTITFTDGGTIIGIVPVGSDTGGVATLTVDDLGVGQHAIEASYSGDDSFTASSGSTAQRVQRAQTSTLLTSSINPSQSGQGVRFTARINPVAPGAGVPTGTVRFTVNGADLGAPVALVDGIATSGVFSSLTPGTYRIAAAYSGDPRFVASSGLLDQGAGLTVTKGTTTTEVVADDAASDHLQTVTFTATVRAQAPATGRPTGVVQFWEGSVLLGSTSLEPAAESGTSRAAFATSTLDPGAHTLRAVYVGNFNFDGSTASTTQVVGPAATVTGITAAPSPAVFGDTVTLTAVVGDVVEVPGAASGTVTFRSGETVLGTADLATVDGRRQASLEVPGLAAGTYAVSAVYGGDAARAGSTSPTVSLVVAKAASSLAASPVWVVRLGTQTQIDLSFLPRLEADLSGRSGPLAGRRVVFTAGADQASAGVTLCEAVTDATGHATCRARTGLVELLVNSGYDARFDGDANHLPTTAHGVFLAN